MSFPAKWSRVQIVSIEPLVDCGRWPLKGVLGESLLLKLRATIDGHDLIRAEARFKRKDRTVPLALKPEGNDLYIAEFLPPELGVWSYQVLAWPDRFASWQESFSRRVEGGESPAVLQSELQDGALWAEQALGNAQGSTAKKLRSLIAALRNGDIATGLDPNLAELVHELDQPRDASESATYRLIVDRPLAKSSAWYEFFPRSAGKPGIPATLVEAAERLSYVAGMGFDVVYIPPIHPIGTTARKGRDGSLDPKPEDPGSPWAIGSEAGGFTEVHPDLGGLEAFRTFQQRARELGLELALDIAFQCSPDHPWVKEHPEWFYQRPDGTIRYAENPPKKYQDIYPLNFENPDWKGLWHALREVFVFWIKEGVRIFRVDNPHTKPVAFWEWVLLDLIEEYPDLIFLSEAHTRPALLYGLAKAGFSQSYTYFPWRNTKNELVEYVEEIFFSDVSEYFRPNFWTNTPDILTDYLVYGGRPAFVVRLLLAATLSPCYGIYGPAFELMIQEAHPEKEEYANNEKYQIKAWNWDNPFSLAPLITRINQIRRENPAFARGDTTIFCPTDNPELLAYLKHSGDKLFLLAVNLDPYHLQHGWVDLPEGLGIPLDRSYLVRDLLSDERYFWQGTHNYLHLEPNITPVNFLQIHTKPRREQDFEYYF